MIKKEIDQGKRHIISSKLLCGQDANLQVQKQIVCTVKRSLIRKVPPLSVFLLPDQKVQKIQGKNGALSPKIWVPFCCLSPKVPDLAGFFGQVASYLTEIEESVDRAGGRAGAYRFFDSCKVTRHLPEKSGKIRHLWGKATERNPDFGGKCSSPP